MKKNEEFDSDVFGETDAGQDNAIFGAEENTQQGQPAFAEAPAEENNIFGNEQGDDGKKKTKKDGKSKKPLFIILGVVAVLLVAAVFTLPMLFVNMGDSSLAEGDYEQAETYYKLCFGTQDTDKRLSAVKAIKLIGKGKKDEGINSLLDSGIKVTINYDLDGGEFVIKGRHEKVTLTNKSQFGGLYKAKKPYYSFETWDLVRYNYDPKVNVASVDISLKAVFELKQYAITYTGFSDVAENPKTYTYESETITLKNPTRVGYDFLYWEGTDLTGEPTTVVIPKGSSEDRSYFARWQPRQYQVTMDSDVEWQFEENPKTVTFDDAYELDVVKKRGYHLVGWEDENNVYSTDGIWATPEHVTVRPKWEIETYYLTYNYAGGNIGTAVNAENYRVDTEDFNIVQPSRTGHTFINWKIDVYDEHKIHKTINANGEEILDDERNIYRELDETPETVMSTHGVPYTIRKNTVGDMDFTAVWEANKYTVRLNAKGGNVSSNAVVVTYDSPYSLPTPTKTGYTFNGWYAGNAPFAASGVWTNVGDVAVEARWTANRYNVTFNANGGSVSQGSASYTYDSSYTLPTPTRNGYTFKGWSMNGTTVSGSIVWKTASNVTLTALWQANKYTISLNAKGGTVSSSSVTATYDQRYDLPTPTKTGYSFNGWYSGNTPFASSGKWTNVGNASVEARWTANRYNVTFNANGGNVSQSSSSYTYDSSYSLPTPTRTGYTFMGWRKNSASGEAVSASGTWKVAQNVTLVASWQANRYTVSLNANGGSVSSSRVTVTYDSAYSLPTPTKKGHTFLGWYNGSSKFTNSGTWRSGSDVTLTASWKVNTYTATLDVGDDGVVSRDEFRCDYGDRYSLPTPTREGYTFEGWKVGSNSVSASGTWEWDRNVEFVAKWDANEYTVRFDANGGSVSRSYMDVTYDKSYEFPEPERKGYEFVGWYSGSKKYATKGRWTKASNMTLTAKWELIECSVEFDANGGSVSPSKMDVVYGQRYSFPTPTREGYDFLGWYRGSTRIAESGTWEWEYNMDLTAKWEAYEYTIRLDPAGGSVSSTRLSVTYGENYSLPTPSRAGYIFKGWYYGGTPFANSGKWRYSQDVSLVASWSVDESQAVVE